MALLLALASSAQAADQTAKLGADQSGEQQLVWSVPVAAGQAKDRTTMPEPTADPTADPSEEPSPDDCALGRPQAAG